MKKKKRKRGFFFVGKRQEETRNEKQQRQVDRTEKKKEGGENGHPYEASWMVQACLTARCVARTDLSHGVVGIRHPHSVRMWNRLACQMCVSSHRVLSCSGRAGGEGEGEGE